MAPPEGERFASISSGRSFTCGLRSDGSPVCWGEDLGSGAASPPEGERFVAVSSGAIHACGLRADGSPVCWGDYEVAASTPNNERLVTISGGGRHACGLRSDGVPVCWGSNKWVDDVGNVHLSGQASPPDGVTLAVGRVEPN